MSQERTIYVTAPDQERLRKLITKEKDNDIDFARRTDLKELEAELARARVVEPSAIPGDVITMNSVVQLLDLDTGEELRVTLVYPAEADFEAHKISVLAPIGLGMLGFSVGDEFEWKVPKGERRLEVRAIDYQPEASGDYHL